MRTVVGLVLALACATGCIGRATGHGPTIQAAPSSSRDVPTEDPSQRTDASSLPGSLHTR